MGDKIMKIDDVCRIMDYNKVNSALCDALDDRTLGIVADILQHLPAEDFIELNPNVSETEKSKMFSLFDVPIPIGSLQSNKDETKHFSQSVNQEFVDLLGKINKEGTNVEYPYALFGENNGYNQAHKMYDPNNIEKLGKQAVEYDSLWLSEFVSKNDNVSLALMHTHPAPINKEHNTLYNKHQEILSQLGVRPDGLNISLADVNTQFVVGNQIKNMGKNIQFESVILMHDGSLVSFSMDNGLNLTCNKQISMERQEPSRTVNEFGEIVLGEKEFKMDNNVEIPIFEPPNVTKVELDEIKRVQDKLHLEQNKKIDKPQKNNNEENKLMQDEELAMEI